MMQRRKLHLEITKLPNMRSVMQFLKNPFYFSHVHGSNFRLKPHNPARSPEDPLYGIHTHTLAHTHSPGHLMLNCVKPTEQLKS